MKATKVVVLLALAVFSVWVTTASAVYEFYVTIEGVKQGKFKSDNHSQAHPGTIAGLEFVNDVKCPRDASSGLPTGRRVYVPVVITKRWDAASPQLFDALVSNEMLKSVLLEFVRTRADGQEETYYTITLQNAVVVGIKQYAGEGKSGDASAPRELEEVSISFQRIIVENKVANTAAMDSTRSR